MKLTNYKTMDVHLLYGLVNTELRNNCRSLEDLCKTHGVDKRTLVKRLEAADYHYSEQTNQFR